MPLLPGMPEIKLPSSAFGIDISGLYGPGATKENANQVAQAENLARSRVENPAFNTKDEVTGEYKPNIAEQVSGMFGGPTLSDIAPQVKTLTDHREATQLREDPKNKTVDFSALSPEDRKNPQKVREYATLELAKQTEADKGFNVDGVTNIEELTKTVEDQTLNKEITKTKKIFDNDPREAQRRLERREDLLRLAEKEQTQAKFDLASLQATIGQAELDREYLDRRDMRDYEYKIQKDEAAQMDKIFALIMGMGNSMF